MKISLEGTVANLQGDLTRSGMTRNNIGALSDSLQQLESRHGKNVHIDCRMVRSCDICGIQLLDVWMQCASFMGIEAKLVNLPDNMQQAMKEVKWL
jgi:ABC-type transporter Mla MlaB component